VTLSDVHRGIIDLEDTTLYLCLGVRPSVELPQGIHYSFIIPNCLCNKPTPVLTKKNSILLPVQSSSAHSLGTKRRFVSCVS